MFTLATRITNRVLGRPSVAKATMWSFALHVSTFAATYAWWSSSVDSISLAGSRHVVQIEATFSETRPARSVELETETESTPPDSHLQAHLREQEADAGAFGDAARLSPAKLPLARRQLVSDMPVSQCRQPAVSRATPGISQRIAQVLIEPRHTVAELDSPEEPTRANRLVKLERRQLERAEPSVAVMAEQLAGIEDQTPPDFSGNRPPVYPALAIQQRLEGAVLLRVFVATSGRVERVEVAKSSGYLVFDRAAVEAVSTWRGRPAHHKGKAVASVKLLPVRFEL